MLITDSVKPRLVLWSVAYFLGGAPHCYEDRDTPGKWWSGYGDDRLPCVTWRGHRGERGQTGFMRFIHALPDQLHNTELLNPFVSEVDRSQVYDDQERRTSLWICHEGQPTEDGRLVYAEVYLLKDKRGHNPVFKVFLDRGHLEEALVECYDDRYVEATKMAAAAVEQQYLDEEARS